MKHLAKMTTRGLGYGLSVKSAYLANINPRVQTLQYCQKTKNQTNISERYVEQ
jgi:hypothetical protein